MRSMLEASRAIIEIVIERGRDEIYAKGGGEDGSRFLTRLLHRRHVGSRAISLERAVHKFDF